jgi:hypothetical protein
MGIYKLALHYTVAQQRADALQMPNSSSSTYRLTPLQSHDSLDSPSLKGILLVVVLVRAVAIRVLLLIGLHQLAFRRSYELCWMMLLLEALSICFRRAMSTLLVVPGEQQLRGRTAGMTGPWLQAWFGSSLDLAKSM